MAEPPVQVIAVPLWLTCEAVVEQAPVVELLAHHPDHDLVGHEVAPVHVRDGLEPGGRARSRRGAEQITGGEVHHAVVLRDAHGLGALPGTLLPQQDETYAARHVVDAGQARKPS